MAQRFVIVVLFYCLQLKLSASYRDLPSFCINSLHILNNCLHLQHIIFLSLFCMVIILVLIVISIFIIHLFAMRIFLLAKKLSFNKSAVLDSSTFMHFLCSLYFITTIKILFKYTIRFKLSASIKRSICKCKHTKGAKMLLKLS